MSIGVHIMNITLMSFVIKISDIDWSSVMNITDCNLAYSMFNSVFLNCYNQCFPIRKVKVTYKNRKRWLTEGLKKSIKVKNKLYVRSIKRPTLHNVRKYKDYKHKLKYLLRKSEKEHYDSLMRRYQSNVKKSWGVIKEVINRNKVKKCNDTFLINGHEESDIKIICNAFNNFYVNVGPSLASKIPASIKTHVITLIMMDKAYCILILLIAMRSGISYPSLKIIALGGTTYLHRSSKNRMGFIWNSWCI